MEVSGSLAVGESGVALTYIKARRGLSPRQIKLILVACASAVGIPVGAWVSESWLWAGVSVEFAIVGLIVGVFVVQVLSGPALRKSLAQRGQKHVLPLTLRLTPDALVYDLDDLVMTARWSCVTDLFKTRKHWVFLVQSSAMVLPRRLFATPDAERDFIGQALSRMTAEARARSPDAAKVAGG